MSRSGKWLRDLEHRLGVWGHGPRVQGPHFEAGVLRERIVEPSVDGSCCSLGLPSGTFATFAVSDDGGACGMRLDSSLVCWGGGNGGSLPTPSGTFNQISSGGYQGVCGVRSDSTMQCWGNSYQPFVFTSTDTGYVQAIEGLYFCWCGLKSGGALTCGGRWDPSVYMPAGNYVQIGGQQDTLCGIDASGTGTCLNMVNNGSTVSSTSTFSMGTGLLVP